MSPVRIFSVPATASADRSSSAAITPFLSGVTRSDSRTATIIPAGKSA